MNYKNIKEYRDKLFLEIERLNLLIFDPSLKWKKTKRLVKERNELLLKYKFYKNLLKAFNKK